MHTTVDFAVPWYGSIHRIGVHSNRGRNYSIFVTIFLELYIHASNLDSLM